MVAVRDEFGFETEGELNAKGDEDEGGDPGGRVYGWLGYC